MAQPITSWNPSGPALLGGSLVYIPTGGKIAFVHASGAAGLSDLPPGLVDQSAGFFTSVNSALATFRANRGDVVVALPGHTETISGADGWGNQVNGCRIVGLGWGTMRPTVTLSAAASQVLLDANDVVIDNFRFIHSTTDVTLGFDVSGAGCQIHNSYIQASDGSNKFTRVLRLSSGADDFVMQNTDIVGGATALTDTVLVNAAVTRPIFRNCKIIAALGTAQGMITFATAAATNILIERCYLKNTVANSTVALKGIASLTGFVVDTHLGVTVADGAGVGTAAFNTPGNVNVHFTHASTITKSNVTAVAATTA